MTMTSRLTWTSDQPDVVLSNDWQAEGMPMPSVRKPRASTPWREVHRERGKRHRVTRRIDHDVAIEAGLAALVRDLGMES